MTQCNTTHPPTRTLNGLQPAFKSKVEQWLLVTPEITVHEAWRSSDRQKCLLNSGASQVQWSNHQDGHAVDVHFKVAPHFPEGSDPRWIPVREKAKKYGIISGWDLWQWDANHFQDVTISQSQKKTEIVPNNVTQKDAHYFQIMTQEVPFSDRLFNVYNEQTPMRETKSLIEIGLYRLKKSLQ
jgi:hypothetical protein